MHQTVTHFKVVDVTTTGVYNRVITTNVLDVVRFNAAEHTAHALGNLAVAENQRVHVGIDLVEVDDLTRGSSRAAVLQVNVFENQAIRGRFR
ncbi:MAG: hypothetical protein BWY72_01781 [Bacteroidetes bacterium ADurb.Bin416]|nr:MAG: hypothetical protein BWY72_01781 [Bacteroidetes bacterium ADurb.Bin416]